jgi:hypothetical protein
MAFDMSDIRRSAQASAPPRPSATVASAQAPGLKGDLFAEDYMSRMSITTGTISSRASWRTFFSKDWKTSVWLLDGSTNRLLVFRRANDVQTWIACSAALQVRHSRARARG